MFGGKDWWKEFALICERPPRIASNFPREREIADAKVHRPHGSLP
jgi:hypothetical protein